MYASKMHLSDFVGRVSQEATFIILIIIYCMGLASSLKTENFARTTTFLRQAILTQRLTGGTGDGFADLKGKPIDNTTQHGMNKLNKGLRYAVMKGDLLEIEKLLAAGAGINAGDISGFRPLHLAAEKGQIEAVEVLLAKV